MKNMVHVPGGLFLMGSEDFYPEERPVHQVHVDGFLMDRHPVTVAEFRRFVKATGYITVAERTPDATHYPGADPDLLVPGSLVFDPPGHPVDLRDPSNWWSYRPEAQWRHPDGPGSTLHGRERHPVTHVAPEDAEAYATWIGKELPTEAEWESAARGGLEGATFVWGNEFAPKGKMMANTWQGEFPWQNLETDGYQRTSPVMSFPPNGYGLFDMAGNVWEWTSDYFATFGERSERSCCVPRNPRATSWDESLVAGEPGANIPRRVIKGGSHLCAPNYCLRYRPAARQSEAIDTSTAHIGFRCVAR
jgi:formylglycine-generating enzyme